MSTAPAPAVRTRFIQAKHVWFFVFGLMALFVLYQRELQLLDAHSFLRQRYLQAPWLLLIHGIFGALALVVAPFQFSNRLRQRHLQLHRVMGRVYVGSVAIAAPVAVMISFIPGPPTLLMASVIQGGGWYLTTATALYCIRTGKISQHREWMMRSYLSPWCSWSSGSLSPSQRLTAWGKPAWSRWFGA